MRRLVVPTLLLVVLAMSVGCSHIAGMNDVYHHPDNEIINTGSGNPYHPTGASVTGVSAVAPAAEKPMEKPMDKPMEK